MARNRSDWLLAPLLGLATLWGCASQPAPAPDPAGVTAPPLARDPQIDAYVQAMRDELSRGKVGIITEVMRLNSDEAKVFWPIYQEYESELFDLGDLRVEAIRQFAAGQRDGTLDDTEATLLAKTYFDFEAGRIELLKAYHGIIAERLSPVRAAQFTQIEHRVGTVIDLLIAAELPLIQREAP